ncbi:MAG: sulfatase-like hydrolase/transferase, partial [Planctomycetaceae bacterium]
MLDCCSRRPGLPGRVCIAGCLVSLVLLPCLDAAADRPNVLVILADDLGYSDLGCYGGEIETPNLDALARAGLRFTQFYNTARCWPTRAAILTGYYAQQVRRDKLPDMPKGVRTGGVGRRPSWAQLLPVMLKAAGYRSYHSGKWHLDGMPLQNGFDRSYYLGDQGRFFSPRVHFDDDRKLPPVARNSGFYATTAIADHAIRCLRDHAEKHADRP